VEATEVFRRLAAADPDHLPAFADELGVLSGYLRRLDRLEEALDVAAEVVGIYRHLASAEDEDFAPKLAESIQDHAKLLWQMVSMRRPQKAFVKLCRCTAS